MLFFEHSYRLTALYGAGRRLSASSVQQAGPGFTCVHGVFKNEDFGVSFL